MSHANIAIQNNLDLDILLNRFDNEERVNARRKLNLFITLHRDGTIEDCIGDGELQYKTSAAARNAFSELLFSGFDLDHTLNGSGTRASRSKITEDHTQWIRNRIQDNGCVSVEDIRSRLLQDDIDYSTNGAMMNALAKQGLKLTAQRFYVIAKTEEVEEPEPAE